jgi:hypothetical protein
MIYAINENRTFIRCKSSYMMLLLLLLFSIVKGYFGISCIYSEESFEWSLDEFDHDEFKIYIDQFESDDYNENNEDKCRVEIFMDYKNRSVTISLGDSFPWSQLDDGEGRLDYLIMFNQNNTEADIYNVLEYACYDQNECNKLFVLGHIHWLTQMNYSLFETHLRSLLLDHINKTGRISNGLKFRIIFCFFRKLFYR